MTIEILKEAMAKLASIPKNDQWLVVDPEGNIYRGTVQEVLPLLIERHPLSQAAKFDRSPIFKNTLSSDD